MASVTRTRLHSTCRAAASHVSIPRSTTLLPFLYQTRTIARRSIRETICKHANHPHTRCLCTSPHRAAAREPSSSPAEDEWGPIQGREPRGAPRRSHTRKSPRSERHDGDQHSVQHARDRFRQQRIHDVPFEHLETPSSSLDKGRPADQSTLTDHERKAFYRLFQSLAPSVDEMGSGGGAIRAAQDYNGEDYFDRGGEPGILEHILTGESANSQELGNPIERYPPALQNMAQQAEARMRLRQRSRNILQSQDDLSEADVDTSHPALVNERQEAKRIEAAMRAAETDQALWKILDEEVFANVRIIQAEEDRVVAEETAQRKAEQQRVQQNQAKQREAEDSVRNEVASRGRSRKNRKDLASSIEPQEAETDLEPSIQILDTSLASPPSDSFSDTAPTSQTTKEPLFTHYPAIYAHLTALALTLLTQRTAYTPLALALIPAIQRIGLTAYALCASTALYNALLAYQYRVFHASHAMLASLAEMDAAGVPVDAETLAIVKRVAAYRAAARTGQLGAMAGEIEQLWGREEEGRLLGEWARRIEGRLERRAVEGVQRRKAVGELRGEGVFG